MPPIWLTAAARLYRALLRLYPSSFRADFADGMAADFDEAAAETWTNGGVMAVAALWLRAVSNLLRTAALQWVRQGALVKMLVPIAAAWISLSAVVSLIPAQGPGYALDPATETQVLIVLMVLTALFPVFAVIVFSYCFLRPNLRRSTRLRRSGLVEGRRRRA